MHLLKWLYKQWLIVIFYFWYDPELERLMRQATYYPLSMTTKDYERMRLLLHKRVEAYE